LRGDPEASRSRRFGENEALFAGEGGIALRCALALSMILPGV
jgi:hypothetical protein